MGASVPGGGYVIAPRRHLLERLGDLLRERALRRREMMLVQAAIEFVQNPSRSVSFDQGTIIVLQELANKGDLAYCHRVTLNEVIVQIQAQVK